MRCLCTYVLSVLLTTVCIGGIFAVEEDPYAEYFRLMDAAAIAQLEMNAELNHSWGLFVDNVDAGQAAERGGLRVGDAIISLDGYRVYGKSEYAMLRWRQGILADDHMIIGVIREKKFIQLDIEPYKFRTLGFNYAFDQRAVCQRILDGAAGHIDGSDPLVYRSWHQFPLRYAFYVQQWLDAAERSPEDLQWLADFSKLYVALCTQEFAQAALIQVTAPNKELQYILDFYNALAQRHKDAEQEPSPAAVQMDLVSYVNMYPYPLHVGPEVGNFPPQLKGLEKALKRVRREPASMFAATRRFGDKVMHSNLVQGQYADRYMETVKAALVDPKRHGGWPYRHVLVSTRDKKVKTTVASLRAAEKNGVEPAWWIQYILTIASYLDERGQGGARLQQALSEIIAFKEVSPAIAYKGLGFFVSLTHDHNTWNARSTLRAAYMQADFQVTLKPSLFLSYLNQRESWMPFTRVRSSDKTFSKSFDRVYKTLAYTKTIDELDQAITALDDASPVGLRRDLLREFIDRYQGWVIAEDVQKIANIDSMAGDNAVLGMLLDQGPELLRHYERHANRGSMIFPLRKTLRNQHNDFEFNRLKTQLKDVNWQGEDLKKRLHTVYLRYGGLIGSIFIADACRDNGHKELSEIYYDKVHKYLDAETTIGKTTNWNWWWRNATLSHKCFVLSASKYQSQHVIDYGWDQMDMAKKKSRWNATPLHMAQAYVHLDDMKNVVRMLKMSFEDVDNTFVGIFMWPDGTFIEGEQKQREKLLHILQDRKALTTAVIADIRISINPQLLNDASFVVLGFKREDVIKETVQDENDDLNDF